MPPTCQWASLFLYCRTLWYRMASGWAFRSASLYLVASPPLVEYKYKCSLPPFFIIHSTSFPSHSLDISTLLPLNHNVLCQDRSRPFFPCIHIRFSFGGTQFHLQPQLWGTPGLEHHQWQPGVESRLLASRSWNCSYPSYFEYQQQRVPSWVYRSTKQRLLDQVRLQA